MRNLVLFFALALCVSAAPIFTVDGIPLDKSDPGIGRALLYNPGHSFLVAWEDLLMIGGDVNGDYNDVAEIVTFGNHNGIATAYVYLGADADIVTFPGGVKIGQSGPTVSFSLPGVHRGDEVVLSMLNTVTGITFQSGDRPAIDGYSHAWVGSYGDECERGKVPEPSTAALFGIGLLCAAMVSRKKK